MNLEFSQKAGAWISIAILILIVGGYFGVYSGLNYLRNSSSQLASQKELYQQQSDRLEKLKDFQSKLDQAKETIALMNEALPVEEHRLSVISILNNLAARSGGKLVSIANESAGEEGEYEEESAAGEKLVELGEEELAARGGAGEVSLAVQSLTVNIVGDYTKVKRFFANLEQNRRPLDPEAFTIDRDGLEIALTHYYLK